MRYRPYWIGATIMAIITIVFTGGLSPTSATTMHDPTAFREVVTAPAISIDFNDLFIHETAAIAVEHERTDYPGRSLHDAQYASANQPGQAWRSTVDAYQHIDPGRRMI